MRIVQSLIYWAFLRLGWKSGVFALSFSAHPGHPWQGLSVPVGCASNRYIFHPM